LFFVRRRNRGMSNWRGGCYFLPLGAALLEGAQKIEISREESVIIVGSGRAGEKI